jgi:glycosidase
MRMVYSLTFSLPGTPVLFYGEEIGMGENLAIEGRLAVRSPMQWSAEPNAGFSTAEDPGRLCRPLTRARGFGARAVNVASQRRDEGSLLNWFERMIRLRKECPELGWGRYRLVPTVEPAVFAHRADWGDRAVVAVHNLSDAAVTTSMDLGGAGEIAAIDDLFRREELRPGRGGRIELDLEPRDHRWFRVRRPGQRIAL